MGRRPIELSAAEKAEVETLAAVLTAEQIADYFGIGRTTFFALVERDPEIAERYKRGKARAIGAIAEGLIRKARAGDTACMIFFLKTQAGWRETSEVTHSLEAAPQVEGRRATDLLLERVNRMAERMRAEAVPALSPVSGTGGVTS